MTNNQAIRQYLGHNQGSRIVRISRSGNVTYTGTIDAFDRSHDYEHFAGEYNELLQKARQEML